MYKAVFLDMDGTLLRSDHSVGTITRNAIQRVLDKGIPVMLVSARPLDGMLSTGRSLQTDAFPIVSLNGSYIVNKGKTFFQSFIDINVTETISERIRQFPTTPVYYQERTWYAEDNNDWVAHEQRILDVKVRIEPVDVMINTWKKQRTGPNKILIMGDAAMVAETEHRLKTEYTSGLNIYTSKPTYLEVMNEKASKENAVKMIIENMNIAREEIIAIGDNFNDRNMIEYAGMGVAMGNAPAEIKAVASCITDTNNNDGVGKALDTLIK